MDENAVSTATQAPTASEPAPAEATSAPAVSNEQAEATQQPQQEEHTPEVALKLDPETGKRTLVWRDDIQPKQETAEAQQEAKPQTYTSDDIVKAIAMGQEIDPARVPDELQGYAAAIQQQRANATQQAAAIQQAMQMQQAQQQAVQQAQQAPQPTPEQAQAERAKAYEAINKIASEKAMQDLGITKEQLDDAQYSDDPAIQSKAAAYNTAVRANVSAIVSTIEQQRAQRAQEAQRVQQEAQAALQVIQPKYMEYQKDPHFNDIDQLMGSYYENLPYKEAQQVVGAIQRFKAMMPTRADAEVLDSYYKKTKEAYYAQQTGVGTTPQPVKRSRPPQVEQTGQQSGPEPPQAIDWSKMRGMSALERSQFFREHFR